MLLLTKCKKGVIIFGYFWFDLKNINVQKQLKKDYRKQNTCSLPTGVRLQKNLVPPSFLYYMKFNYYSSLINAFLLKLFAQKW